MIDISEKDKDKKEQHSIEKWYEDCLQQRNYYDMRVPLSEYKKLELMDMKKIIIKIYDK